MNYKKAQSALEFLTTYGWAFLVILIMIGALAYFGILDPSRFLPDKCVVTTGFGCTEQRGAVNADVVQFLIIPSKGGTFESSAVIANPVITVNGLTPPCTVVNISAAVNGAAAIPLHQAVGFTDVPYNANDRVIFTVSCNAAAGAAGQTANVELRLSATDAGSTLGAKPVTISIGAKLS
jgi:hypothetical protein